MKKYLLSIGTTIIAVAPVAMVVSCNKKDDNKGANVNVTEKTTAELEAAITPKAGEIKNALTGKTSEMKISKIKAVLKDQLDDAYDALIDALTLKSKVDGNIVVTSGSTDITIETSTTTPAVAKTTAELEAAITPKAGEIKNALTGKTSEMKISKVKAVLKDKLDDAYDDLIDALTLKSKTDGSVVVTSKLTEITIATLTTKLAEVDYKEVAKLVRTEEFLKHIRETVNSKEWQQANIMGWLRKQFGSKPTQAEVNQKIKDNYKDLMEYFIKKSLSSFLKAKTNKTENNYNKWAKLAIVNYDLSTHKFKTITFEKQTF